MNKYTPPDFGKPDKTTPKSISISNGRLEASGFEESMRFKKLTNAQRSGPLVFPLFRNGGVWLNPN